ncbi:hypothetical protein [Lysobacter sp. M2-1]|uniref:hypothetical protein n=1 Tax=Lysobacter sp. M2-1 TaxID=2916839 RepID=UPI001F58DDEF|nr:hypothetical protein [Lysobacter sp. M2-1]
MAIDVKLFKKELLTSDVEEFVSKHVFDRTPHVFSDDRAAYASWRRALAKLIQVDASSLVVVGSASVGVSLNPSKDFREFSDGSDIDVAVISPYHFQVAWRFLRNNSHLRAAMTYKERASYDDHRKRLIYWGTVATDILLGYFPFGADWLGASSKMAAASPINGREINFRLYGDAESLTAYSINSVSKLRDAAI